MPNDIRRVSGCRWSARRDVMHGMSGVRPLIFLLEDDRSAADALELVLRDWGADVVHGVNVGDVITASGPRTQDASMIITDFHLSDDTNGVSLARELRHHAPRARVLVLSGSTSGEAQRAANDAGYAFMRKPAQPKDIIAWLERA
jgi:DNA-binding NtrC family response regulator